jgi:hypothetical protein
MSSESSKYSLPTAQRKYVVRTRNDSSSNSLKREAEVKSPAGVEDSRVNYSEPCAVPVEPVVFGAVASKFLLSESMIISS